MALEFTVGAEETHKVGEMGAYRIRQWLDSTFRFRIDRSIYDLDAAGDPYPMMRLPQLSKTDPETGGVVGHRFERFDLRGMLLDENGAPGRILFVECKDYNEAGKQPALYDEYLAVCYSGFVKSGQDVEAPPDMEFMWATTHPFAQTIYNALTTADQIKVACEKHPERLGNETFDMSTAEQLAPRLWLAIVNPRVKEMMMGLPLRQAVLGAIEELTA